MSEHNRRLYRITAAIIAALWIAGGVALDCGAKNTGVILLAIGTILVYGLSTEAKGRLK